ncbi:hypothetical protein CMI37_34690 [Candidatus Pacearchaeota archaeon]|nr:hypothetical protein [Candidatus Pacearchaeota archaeon]
MSSYIGKVGQVDPKYSATEMWLLKIELVTEEGKRWLGAYTSKKGYNTAGFVERVMAERDMPDDSKTLWYVEYETKTEKGYENLYVTSARSAQEGEVQAAPLTGGESAKAPPRTQQATVPMHGMTAANCATEVVKALVSANSVEHSAKAICDAFNMLNEGFLASIEGRYESSEDEPVADDEQSAMDELFKESV